MNEHRGLWRGKYKIYHDFESEQDVFEWVEGYYVSNGDNLHYIITDKFEQYLIDPSTLGECTGLRDKNKKLIFEGDICIVATPNIADDEYGVVRFDENEAVFVIDFGTYTINFCDNVNGSAVEVIGNIYDNPELIPKGAADDE